MSKKLLSILLTVCMLLSMVPMTLFVSAEEEVVVVDEVVDEVVKFFRVARNTDKSKEPKVYEMIEPRLKAASEKYRVTDPYLTEHPQILTNIMEISKNSFGASLDLDDSKKKQ